MLGNTYKAVPEFTKLMNQQDVRGRNPGERMRGFCIYEHPEGRFVTLEFRFGSETIRESFRLEEVCA